MDYNKLLQRLAEIDKPTNESCGDMTPVSTPAPESAPTPPPSMTVNLNAHGMDNIEQMMKLMTAVNPDMINPKSTAPEPPNMIKMPIGMDGVDDGPLDGEKTEIAPLAAVGAGLGRAAASSMGAGSIGQSAGGIAGRMAGGATADMMNGDNDDIESREEYANEPDEQHKDIDYITNKVAGGMNKPKGTYPKVSSGDNPMQKTTRMEGDELRASIRAELQQRLAEAKGVK